MKVHDDNQNNTQYVRMVNKYINIFGSRKFSTCSHFYLSDYLTERSHRDTITVGQGEGLVVIEDTVEVLYPDGIYGSV